MSRPVARRERALPRAAALLAVLGTVLLVPSLAHGQQYDVLHQFVWYDVTGTVSLDGRLPDSHLTLAPDGTLCGVARTSQGGWGTAFRIHVNSEGSPYPPFSLLGSFLGTNGASPGGGLVPGGDGWLYGAAQSGGVLSGSAGVLYRIPAAGGTPTRLWEFGGAAGLHPTGEPLLQSGVLWGVTPEGAPPVLPPPPDDPFEIPPPPVPPGAPTGAVYAYNVATGTLEVVCQMVDDETQQADPWLANTRAGLVPGGDGMFYGVASQSLVGTPMGTCGSVYRVDPVMRTVHTVFAFRQIDGGWPNGARPVGKLVAAPDGTFYGVTELGGEQNNGVLFAVSPSGGLATLYSFSLPTGARPGEGLCLTDNGMLLGTTTTGGQYGCGVVFQYDPVQQVYTVLHDFTGGDGSFPQSRETCLVSGGQGVYYGATLYGGSDGLGVVYALSFAGDGTPPVTTASLGGTKLGTDWFVSPVTVTLTALDPDGPNDVAATYYQIDGGSQQTYNGPFTVTGDGAHQLAYWSVDKAGNEEKPQPSQTVSVDTAAPVVTVAASPVDLSPANGRMVTVTVTGTLADTTSGIDPTSARYAVKDSYGLIEPSGAIAVDADGHYGFTVLLEARRDGRSSDGRTYTVTVRAADKAGNEAHASAAVVVPHNSSGGSGPGGPPRRK